MSLFLRSLGMLALLLPLLPPAAAGAADTNGAAATSLAPGPRVFLLSPADLGAIRARVATNDPALRPALRRLEQDAREALALGPYSVTRKRAVPPSGDRHDYMSRAPYFWPAPGASNGAPYVRRDGERNPETRIDGDSVRLDHLAGALETLALAWYYTTNQEFAARSTLLIRTWFLDPETRMNPNFNFGQAVQGVSDGRASGLIEARSFTRVVDAVGLLQGAPAWTSKDQADLEEWFVQFLKWMRESPVGREERLARNNHGTIWDFQAAAYAFFTGQDGFGREILEAAKQRRIASQIKPDGSMSFELERTRSWSYSVFNLAAFMTLAGLGDRAGVDLWHFETADGRSIRKAVDFLLPYLSRDAKWPYPQLGERSPEALYPLVRRAAEKYPTGPYARLVAGFPPLSPEDRMHLLREGAK